MGRHDLHRSTCAPYSFAVRERPIGACPDASRGSSARLGLDALLQELPDPLYDENAPYADGALRYELTDHLGNARPEHSLSGVEGSRRVCAVVSDALEGYSTDADPDAEEYHAELLSAQEYEPFGSLLPGRNYSSGSYRFGFNGKENDNEVHGTTGTFQDYGMRAYDTRVARFFSVDPIAEDYPELTPFQFASNTPIQAIDLDGLEAAFVMAEARLAVPVIAMLGVTGSAFGGIVMDVHGNIGAIYGAGAGVSGGMGMFARIQVGLNTEVNVITDLRGWGFNVGVSLAAGVGVGFEINQAYSTDNQNIPDLRQTATGFNFALPGAGNGLGGAGYGEASYTWVDYYGNIFKGANEVFYNLQQRLLDLGIDPTSIGLDNQDSFDTMILQLQELLSTSQVDEDPASGCSEDDCE